MLGVICLMMYCLWPMLSLVYTHFFSSWLYLGCWQKTSFWISWDSLERWEFAPLYHLADASSPQNFRTKLNQVKHNVFSAVEATSLEEMGGIQLLQGHLEFEVVGKKIYRSKVKFTYGESNHLQFFYGNFGVIYIWARFFGAFWGGFYLFIWPARIIQPRSGSWIVWNVAVL